MPVRILVDLLFYTGTRGGTETYAREVLRRLPDVAPDVRLTAIANRVGADRVREFFPGDVDVVSWVGGDRATWAAGEALVVDSAARRHKADVIWCPSNFGPIFRSPLPRVTTTHDIIYHATPTSGGGLAQLLARIASWLVSRAALTSDAVITVSHDAANAIHERVGVALTLLTVIPHGTSEPYPPADSWAELAAIGIRPGRQILLSTGNRLPHKNFDTLLRAVASMEGERPRVVIPGGRGHDPLSPLVSELGLEQDVILPGWVTSAQLEALYDRASLYVCASLAEGFGLPVIDAMRRGCVVIANDIPVLREVGGDAAVYVDARSPTALAEAIDDTLRNDQTIRRNAGARHVERYNWERSAAETVRVIQAAAASRPRSPSDESGTSHDRVLPPRD